MSPPRIAGSSRRSSIHHVVDFRAANIYHYNWPDFNVADSCIVIGACRLLLEIFRPESPRPDPAPTSVAQGRASASPRAQAHAPHTEPKCLAHAPSCGSSSPAHYRSGLPPPRSHRSWSRSPPPPKKPCPPTLSSKQLNHRNSRTQGTARRLGSLWLLPIIGHRWSHFGHTPPSAATCNRKGPIPKDEALISNDWGPWTVWRGYPSQRREG